MPQAADARQDMDPDWRARPSPGGTSRRMRATKLYERESCRLARDMASVAFGVPADEIASPHRTDAETRKVRHSAMYLAHVAFQVRLTAVAEEFGRDRTGVAYAIRRVEERRDETDFDAEMARLERLASAFRGMMAGMGYGAGAGR